jgi:hypothetical protein
MLADLSTSRLNCAVQVCLHRCYRAENPVSALAEYKATLRRLGWDEADLEQLEFTVLRILRRVIQPPASDKMPRSRASNC